MTEREREIYEGMSERWRRAVNACSPTLRSMVFNAYEHNVMHGKPYAPQPPSDDWKRRPRHETADPHPPKREPVQQDFGDRRLPDP